MVNISCVLFAGGKSSRMGEYKSLLPFGGYATLTQFQYERLKKFFSRVYISTKNRDKFEFDAPFLLDPSDAEYAPTAGFVALFRELEDERFAILSVDTPFIDEQVFAALLEADDGALDAVIAKTETGSHPLCGIYHRSLAPEFERMLRERDHRLGKMLSVRRTRYVSFSADRLFANLNHPHEYREALSRFSEPDR